MIHVFYKNRHTIYQLMIVLMFVSGAIFMFTFDGTVSESQATGCCSGGESQATSFAADSSSDYGSDIPMDTSSIGKCCGGQLVLSSSSNSGSCTCLHVPGSSEDRACGDCANDDDCGGSLANCGTGCNKPCKECTYGTKCSGDLCAGGGCCTKK